MRLGTLRAVLVCALLGTGCQKSESTEAEVSGGTAVAPTLAEVATRAKVALANFGGVVFAAGGHSLEVLPYRSGEVVAAFRTEAGIASAEAGATVEVTVTGEDGQPHPLPLVWDPERMRYVGDAGVKLAPGPLSVKVEADGKAETAAAPKSAVAPAPDQGGTALVAGEVGAELKAHVDGTLEARVVDAAGDPLPGVESVVVEVEGEGEGKPAEPVKLTWSAELQLYTARSPLVAKLASRPVQLVVRRKGAEHRGRLSSVVVTRAPEAGGRVVVAGTHQIELVPAEDGFVEAIVVGPSGAVLSPDATVKPTLTLEVEGKTTPLEWDPTQKRFRAKLAADLAIAPVRVDLRVNGRRHRGRVRGLARAQAVHAAQVSAEAPGASEAARGGGGAVEVQGGLRGRIERPTKAVSVRAPGAALHLKQAGQVRAAAGGARVRTGAGGDVSAVTGRVRARTSDDDDEDEDEDETAPAGGKARVKIGGRAGVKIGK